MTWAGERRTQVTGHGMTVWTRRIAGADWIFWAWPDAVAIYRDQPGRIPQLLHYFRKET